MLAKLLPGKLAHLLFRNFEAKEDFLAQVADVMQKYPDRPYAFALFGGGFVEFWAIRLFLFEKFGARMEINYATRLPSLYIESGRLLLRRFAAWLRIGQNPPSRIRLCSQELLRGRPIILNFENTDRKKPFETPAGEKDLAYLSEQNPNLLIVPVVFVWRRKARIARPDPNFPLKILRNIVSPVTSPWQFLLGDPYSPTGIRKIAIMLRQYGQSTLRLAEPIGVSDFNAKVLRRKILTSILAEKKIVVGPTYRSTRLIAENILRSASFTRLVRTLAADEGVSEEKVLRRAEGYFNEISARYSHFAIETCAWLLRKVFSTIFEEIVVDDRDFENLRALSREGVVVFVPCHRSYVDFLLLSTILFAHDFVPPHIAAGINLNFWPIGTIFKKCGAFFIRRSFRGNVLYSEVFRRYVAALLSNRVNLEFFIEGTRSRNGKLAPPKYGMLKMIMDSQLEGLVSEKVRLVPVSIVYDRVTEDQAHKRELEGGEKVQESALGIVKSSRVLFRRYGKVNLRFGEAINLDEWIQEQIGDGRASDDMRRLGIQKLAFEVCHRINEVMPLTAVGLVAAVLLAKPGADMPKSELEAWLELVKLDLEKTGAPLVPELQEDFMRACRRATARLVEDKIVEKYHLPAGGLGLRVPEKQRVAALYYKNSAIHALLIPAIAGVSHGDAQEMLDLRSYLSFEFFFSDKEAYLKNVRHVPAGVMTDLYAFMLDDTLETLSIGLQALIQMRGLRLDHKEWRNRFMRFGRTLITENKAWRIEGINTQGFVAFFEIAKNKGWLKASAAQETLFAPEAGRNLEEALLRVRHFRSKLRDWDLVRKAHLGKEITTAVTPSSV